MFKFGDRVKGRTLHTDRCVVGILTKRNYRESTVTIQSDDGMNFLCRQDTSLELLQPKQTQVSVGGSRHMDRCPAHLRHHLLPSTVLF